MKALCSFDVVGLRDFIIYFAQDTFWQYASGVAADFSGW